MYLQWGRTFASPLHFQKILLFSFFFYYKCIFLIIFILPFSQNCFFLFVSLMFSFQLFLKFLFLCVFCFVFICFYFYYARLFSVFFFASALLLLHFQKSLLIYLRLIPFFGNDFLKEKKKRTALSFLEIPNKKGRSLATIIKQGDEM